MDDVFRALADPSRRLLLDSLNTSNGQTLRELCSVLQMARQSVSKHLAVLEAAELIVTRWQGREKLHYLNAEPINAIADRWIHQYDRVRAHTLADLKTVLEGESMTSNPDFVYTTYIRTTPERLVGGHHHPGVLSACSTWWATLWCRTGRRGRRTPGVVAATGHLAPRPGHPRVGPVPQAVVRVSTRSCPNSQMCIRR